MKKYILIFLFLISSLSFTYDTTTELYIQNYKENIKPEVRVILEDSSLENYELNIELAVNDDEKKIDVAKIKLYFKNIDLEIGRNRIGWGVGTNFNSSDIFNEKSIFSAFDPFYRKEGRDSIIFTKYFDNSNFQIIYASPKEKNINNYKDKKESDYGFKYKTNTSIFDLDFFYLSQGKHEIFNNIIKKNDKISGFDFKSNLPILNLGIWNEFIYSKDKNEVGTSSGIDRYFMEKFYFNIEYYRNYNGQSDKNKYDYSLIQFFENLAKNYLIPSFKIEFNEKINTYSYSLLNLDDASFLVGNTINYFFNDFVTINLGIYYYHGKNNSEYYFYQKEYGTLSVSTVFKIIF